MIPSGYFTSREIFDRIGRRMFGNDWNGDLEYRARHDLRTREELAYLSKAPGTKAGGTWAKPANWKGPWVGWTNRRPYPDEGSDEYEAERSARIRYESVFNEFLKELEATIIRAAALDKSGKLHHIAPAIWRTSRARYYIENGRGPAGDYYRNRERFVHEGELLIEASSAPPQPQPHTTDSRTLVSSAGLLSMVKQVADGTFTQSQVKAQVRDLCAKTERRFTEKMWRTAWNKVPPKQKRSRGETDKTIKKKPV